MELDHIAVNASDPLRLVAFYVDVLGLTPMRVTEYERGDVPFPSVRIGRSSILDFFPFDEHSSEGIAPGERLNHFCFAIESTMWTGMLKRLKAYGVEIITGPAKRFGARGMGESVYFHDPEGNVVELRHYPQEGAGT
ncbi:VOC family protein [Desulfovibrio inopinatus]|uniref:VOC family protein n=1 Tax=Desulfovibrio inopinatus TaxID=102109 RepID=UPI0004289E19|nr:VOC family protein [Desulfovibrio inopinatus]